MKSSLSLPLDKLGICSSAICMTHCLSIPLLFILGFDTLFLEQEWIEWTIITFSMLFGFVSFIPGFMAHRKHHILVLFLAGFLLIINAELIPHPVLSVAISIVGASILIYTHMQNLHCKRYAAS